MSNPIQQLDRIHELAEAGVGAADIAWQLRCPSEAVTAVLGGGARVVAAPDLATKRGDWSSDEDVIVDEMQRAGLTPVEVRGVLRASGVDRPIRSVSLRMRALAERSDRQKARRAPLP